MYPNLKARKSERTPMAKPKTIEIQLVLSEGKLAMKKAIKKLL